MINKLDLAKLCFQGHCNVKGFDKDVWICGRENRLKTIDELK
jgi:hypothetical protein